MRVFSWWTNQSLHVVDTARKVSDEVVAEVELLQAGQVGQRGWQGRQLVVRQTQHLKDRTSVRLSHAHIMYTTTARGWGALWVM